MKLTDEQRKLVEANVSLIGSYLSEHAPRWLVGLYASWMDAHQTCALALMHAVAKHDGSRGSLATYAYSCMYHALLADAGTQHLVSKKRRGFYIPTENGHELNNLEADVSIDIERAYEWLGTVGVSYFEGRPIKQGLLRRVLRDGAPEASDSLKAELFRELGEFTEEAGFIF